MNSTRSQVLYQAAQRELDTCHVPFHADSVISHCVNRIRPPLPLDLCRFAAYNLTFPADSVISHSECPAPPDLYEPAAQDQPFRCGDEAPDPREDGAHLQRPPHRRQAAGSEVGQPS